MCLSVPMKIISIEGASAEVESGGVIRKASVLFLDEPSIGDYVLVHAGFAITKLDEQSAKETHALLAKMDDIGKKEANS